MIYDGEGLGEFFFGWSVVIHALCFVERTFRGHGILATLACIYTHIHTYAHDLCCSRLFVRLFVCSFVRLFVGEA